MDIDARIIHNLLVRFVLRAERSALFMLCLALAFGAHGASLTWDADTGTTGSQDGSGTWTTGAGGWWNGSANVNWAASDIPTFGAGTDGTYPITVGSVITCGTPLTFNNSGYTLSAASTKVITFGGTVAVASGKTATVSTNVELTRSAGAFTLNGPGTLNISGTGSKFGSSYGGASAIGTGARVNVQNGGKLFSGSSITLSGITGGSQLTVDGGSVSVGAALNGNLVVNTSGSGSAIVTVTNGGSISTDSTIGGLRFGGSGGWAVFNLDGGTLTTAAVYENNAAVLSTNNFNGGILKAVSLTSSNATFMNGLNRANVRNGGSIIDPNGENITISQDLLHSDVSGDNATDGGLTIVGAGGTLTLTGANTYTGLTRIGSNNVLSITAPYNTLGSGVVVSNGGRLRVNVSTSSTLLPPLTLKNGSGIVFDLGSYNPANVPAIINANLTVSGSTIIDIAGNLIPVTNGIVLLAYTNKTGLGGFVLGSLPVGVAATVTDTGAKLLLNLAVSNSSTALVIFAGSNPSAYGDRLTFQATISPFPLDGEPVTFYDGATAIGTGITVGGSASFTTAALTVGSHSITAKYLGNASTAGSTSPALPQIVIVAGISRVATMPKIPTPFLMRDWKVVATNYDSFVFNYGLTGTYLPLIKNNTQYPNFNLAWFGLPSYVGATNYSEPEAINAMAAVLGASLVGIDKSNQGGRNFVQMMSQYFNHSDGVNVLFNNSRATVSDFWYQLFPHILFAGLVDRYPATASLSTAYSVGGGSTTMNNIFSTVAQKWYVASQQMGGTSNTAPTFIWNGYNFNTSQPFSGSWVEPEGAAGVAWLEYMAWRKFGQTNANFLQAADWSLQFMQNSGSNIQYEVLLPYGALTAARMNAELGRSYDVNRFLNWCFDGGSYCRNDWGVISDTWGGSSVHGLAGSITDGGGYAFAMNTFEWAGALAPVARYDQRFAHDLGKWLLNVANNSRLFYSTYVAVNHQSSPDWLNGTNDFIAYEGLRKSWNGTNLYATGDAVRNSWAGTDYALYGGSHVGMLAALVGRTSDDKILQLDLLATDFFKDAAYPTYLIYNPYATNTTFSTSFGAGTNDLLDITGEKFLATNVAGPVNLTLPADSAIVVVVIPSGAAMGTQTDQMFANGRIVNYRYAGLDTDGDGLPDWWESRYYGNISNASPTAVAVGGRNNLSCYQLGESPFATNVLNVQLKVQFGTGYPQLTLSTIGGKTYTVEIANKLGRSNSWSSILSITETNSPVGMPGTQSYTDLLSVFSPTASNHFYRVKLQY
jgi:hypothetical protein